MRRLLSVAPLACAAVVACTGTQDFRTTALGDAPNEPPAAAPPTTLPGPGAPAQAPAVIVLATDQGLAPEYPDSQGPFAVVTDETWVYWLDAWSHLARVRKGGGKVESLGDTEAAPHLLVLSGNYLYFTNVPQRRIERMPSSGGAIEPVTPASTDEWRDVQQLVVDGPRITWIDALRLLRCEAMPCTAPTEIPLGSGLHPSALATFGEHIFVPYLEEEPQLPGQLRPGGITVPREGGQLSIMPLMYSSVVGDVEPTSPQLTAVYAASEHLVVRAAWPGALAPRVLASGEETPTYPYALQLAGSYVYWLNRGGASVVPASTVPGAIMRVKKDGTAQPEKVYQADDALHDLRVGHDALFLTTNGGRVLQIPRPADGPLR